MGSRPVSVDEATIARLMGMSPGDRAKMLQHGARVQARRQAAELDEQKARWATDTHAFLSRGDAVALPPAMAAERLPPGRSVADAGPAALATSVMEAVPGATWDREKRRSSRWASLAP